jgi:hypothetical protein
MAGEWGRYCKLRADAHVLSECSDQEVPPVVTLWDGSGAGRSCSPAWAGWNRWPGYAPPRRYRMASGNGARIGPAAVPMTITRIGAGELVLETGRGHAIDPEPTSVYP